MAISNPRIVNSWTALGPRVSKPPIFVTKRAGSANRQIDLCNDGRGPGWPNSIQNLDQSVSQSVKVVSLSDGVRVASIYMPCPVVVHMQSQAHPLIAKNFSASFLPWLRICKRLPTVLVCFPKAWAAHFGATMDFISCITPLSARINASKFQNSSKIPLKIPGVWKNRGDQSLATISRPNFGLKILTKTQLQKLGWNSD